MFPSAQADLGPPLDGVVAGDGLQQDHARTVGVEAVRGVGRQQRHVAPAGDDATHRCPHRLAVEADRARLAGGRDRGVEAHEAHFHLAVEHQGELVVGTRAPRRRSVGPDGLEDVLHVLTDGHLLVRLGHRRHFEDVGEGVALRVVIDQLDATLLVVGQRPELGRVLHRHPLAFTVFAMRTLVRISNSIGRGGPPRRGLAVLRSFDAQHAALTLSDVARLTGLTRATARRLLLTFVALGYMHNDGRRFELTPKVLDLGHSYVSSLRLADIAQPSMEAMSERVHESVSCAVLDGEEIVYVARVPAARIMTISLALGSRLPAFCTSLGRVLLAELPADELDAYLAQLVPEQR